MMCSRYLRGRHAHLINKLEFKNSVLEELEEKRVLFTKDAPGEIIEVVTRSALKCKTNIVCNLNSLHLVFCFFSTIQIHGKRRRTENISPLIHFLFFLVA